MSDHPSRSDSLTILLPLRLQVRFAALLLRFLLASMPIQLPPERIHINLDDEAFASLAWPRFLLSPACSSSLPLRGPSLVGSTTRLSWFLITL